MAWRALVPPVMVLSALVGLALQPAGAGQPEQSSVIVSKLVEGPVPPGAVFEVEVTCTALDQAGDAADVGPVTIRFDESGTPLDPSSIPVGAGYACTAVETEANGATVAYACEMTVFPNGTPVNGGAPAACVDDQTVAFSEPSDSVGTIAVINTFTPAPEPGPVPDAAADAVAARPAFTG